MAKQVIASRPMSRAASIKAAAVAAKASAAAASVKVPAHKPIALVPDVVTRIDPKTLRIIKGYNVRAKFDPENDTADKELLGQIKADGVQTPLVVTPIKGQLHVVAGHRRLAAALLAGTKLVPVLLEKDGTSEADRDMDLITSNSGKPLSNLERGIVFARLREVGWNDKQIARLAGISARFVQELCRLAAAPDDIKDVVKSGAVAATAATEIMAEQGDKAPAVLKRAAELAKANTGKKAGKATAAQLKAAVAEVGTPKATGKHSKPVAPTAPVAPVLPVAPKPAKAPVDDGKTPALRGPFSVDAKTNGGCGLLDGNREGIGAACDPGHARAMVLLLNVAWNATNKNGKKA